MRWGNYDLGDMKLTPVIYFGGETDNTIVGLGGSMKNMIGSSMSGDSSASSASATPFLMEYLLKELNIEYPDPDRDRWLAEDRAQGRIFSVLDAVGLANCHMRGPIQTVEFMARRLQYGKSAFPYSHSSSYESVENTKGVLLATPLYIAMAD